MPTLWSRIPPIIRAIAAGLAVLVVGNMPWVVFANLNLKFMDQAPWSVPFTILLLWLFWKYLNGDFPGRPAGDVRRHYLRVNKLTTGVWLWSLLAGGSALVCLAALRQVLLNLVHLSQPPHPDLSHYSIVMIYSMILMGAASSGIVEEAAFRGYMQVPLENRYGLIKAILISGTVFGIMHFSHSWMTIGYIPVYIVIAGVYGMLAGLTGSIVPGIFLHAAGNAIQDILAYWRGNNPESVTTIWETGSTPVFLINCALVSIFSFLSLFAYRKLFKSHHRKDVAAIPPDPK